ncbi:MAG: NADP-dependent isocitrate dehydrogenase [Burkholderiales bacterium]
MLTTTPQLEVVLPRDKPPSAGNRPQTLVRDTITLIPGDGIGFEIADAVRRVFSAADVPIDWERCDAGQVAFSKGIASGVPNDTLASIQRNRVVLKGPLETPVGEGGKSANVTLRKLFETYANVRPARELAGVPSPYAGRGIDLVVVRENVEDLYAGIEHMQSADVAQALKIISRKGSEKIIRFAFELARAEGRKLVHCATKANILKLTEGLFKRVFEEVAKDYPDITAKHIIVDNCAHQLVMRPEQFEVIVTTNMNGDILSDLASGLVGGLGFAPSANLGADCAIFEAVHGSAPDIAGRGIANPTASLLSAVMMLRYLGRIKEAALIEGALLSVIEKGHARTGDFARGNSVSTAVFTDAVIDSLGETPATLPLREHRALQIPKIQKNPVAPRARRALVGVDIFIESELHPGALAERLKDLTGSIPLSLKMISNRGVQVYPPIGTSPDCVDVYRCRFVSVAAAAEIGESELMALLTRISRSLRWMHVEKLQEFDGKPGFTKAQGEA